LDIGDFGRGTGIPFNMSCHENTFVTKIEGKAHPILNAIKFICSDGYQSEAVGVSGGQSSGGTLSLQPLGIQALRIRHDESIDAIGYGAS